MKTSFPSVAIRSVAIGLGLVVSIAPRPAFADPRTNATCTSDSKLLNGGTTEVFGEGPGTYWDLIEGGLQSAFGNDEAAKIQYLSGVFGIEFATLDEARDYNLQALSAAFDKNQDGLVCVYDLRGRGPISGTPTASTPISRSATTRSASSMTRCSSGAFRVTEIARFARFRS